MNTYEINKAGCLACTACDVIAHHHGSECDPTAILTEQIRRAVALGLARRHPAIRTSRDIVGIVSDFLASRGLSIVNENLEIVEGVTE